MDYSLYEETARRLKNEMFETSVKAGTGHLSSCLSCAEILITLFYGGILRYRNSDPKWDGRDRFVLSKGHAGVIYYAILADLGFFPMEELSRFGCPGGLCSVHVDSHVPGVEVNAGSLGGGYGVAVGMAQAAKLDMKNHLTFALLGDGECCEGVVWESAMYAARYRLNNLVTIIDHNHMSCTGFLEDHMGIEPLESKWRTFGFHTVCVDGHDIEALSSVFKAARSRKTGKPLCVIADTVKAHGLPSIENTPLCHNWVPKTEAEIASVREELNGGAG